MFCADAATLDCKSGTILGRDVVPEVCRISATSSGRGAPVSAVPAAPSAIRVEVAGRRPVSHVQAQNSQTKAAWQRRGPDRHSPAATIKALAFRSSR